MLQEYVAIISAMEANVATGRGAFEVPINHLTKKASAQEVIPSVIGLVEGKIYRKP